MPFGETEANLILSQLGKGLGSVETTSCGRVLDAVAAVLGVCYERSYEGEPAMKLESAAVKGKDVLKLKPVFHGDTLETASLLEVNFRKESQFTDCRFSLFRPRLLSKRFRLLGGDKALVLGVKGVGFSGGAACNQILAKVMRKTVEDAGSVFCS